MTKVHDHLAFNNDKGEFEFELTQVDQSKILIKAIFLVTVISKQ